MSCRKSWRSLPGLPQAGTTSQILPSSARMCASFCSTWLLLSRRPYAGDQSAPSRTHTWALRRWCFGAVWRSWTGGCTCCKPSRSPYSVWTLGSLRSPVVWFWTGKISDKSIVYLVNQTNFIDLLVWFEFEGPFWMSQFLIGWWNGHLGFSVTSRLYTAAAPLRPFPPYTLTVSYRTWIGLISSNFLWSQSFCALNLCTYSSVVWGPNLLRSCNEKNLSFLLRPPSLPIVVKLLASSLSLTGSWPTSSAAGSTTSSSTFSTAVSPKLTCLSSAPPAESEDMTQKRRGKMNKCVFI